jgi:hypothetical protein
MLDFAQNFLASTDLPSFLPSVINLSGNFSIDSSLDIADLHQYINMDLLAQQFNQDVMGDLGKGWNNFVKSGQIWALMIGVVVGYFFRSITNA